MFRYLKKICLVLLMLIIVGCGIKYNNKVNTIVYNLNIGKTFEENIVFTLDSNSDKLDDVVDDDSNESFEYQLFKTNNSFSPVFNNSDLEYKKMINKDSKKLEAILEFNYLEREFDYSQFIMSCFKNYDMVTDEKYFEATISGEFYCWNGLNIDINVTSDFSVIESNGEKINNKYIWNINKDNYKGVDIYYKVYRNYDKQIIERNDSMINIFGSLKYIFGIIVVIILMIVLYKFYKSKKVGSDI